MKRLIVWIMVHNLMLWVDTGVYWVWHKYHTLAMKVAVYCLDRSRNCIPDEFQDQLIDREETDSSCEELGCWK